MGSNAEKAANMIVILGEEAAAEVMGHLNESEIEILSKAISTVKPAMGEEAEKDAEELYQLLVANRYVAEGGKDYAQKVIKMAMGSGPAKRIIDRLSSSYASWDAFQAMDKVNPIQLSQFIQHEHPQTIALVLAHLGPRAAAELVESLPEPIQAQVSLRMASIEEVPPDVIKSIASVLEEKLKPAGNYGESEGLGGVRSVAEMFNRLDRRRSRSVLEEIEVDQPEIANSIRQLMFIFEDIQMLDDNAMREILQRLDKKSIAEALKGTDSKLQNQFFKNMSQRATEMLKEEMEVMGPIKARDAHRAQQSIVDVVHQLEEEGVIGLGADEDDEYVQ